MDPTLGLTLLFFILFLAPLQIFSPVSTAMAAATSASTELGLRLELSHVDSARNLDWHELLRLRLIRGAKNRPLKFKTKTKPDMPKHDDKDEQKQEKPGPGVHPSQGEYLVDLAIGTPPVPFTAILDTGSDLIWTQCKDCAQCVAQPTPLYDPQNSVSFFPAPCSSNLCLDLPQSTCNTNCFYNYTYADGSGTIGFLATETLTFSTSEAASVPGISFGCSLNTQGPLLNSSGLVGFGRGPLSLNSQLGVSRFSYCFVSSDDVASTSPLFLGSAAQLTGPQVKTTPILPNSVFQSFYYLSLQGITVGETRLPIQPETFEIATDGTGGTIIDSGTNLLNLHEVAYEQVVNALESEFKMPSVSSTTLEVLDVCFNTTDAGAVPKLEFHFEGADWEIPTENYIVDDGAGLLCAMILKSTGNITIFGNIQTQNTHILYDLKNEELSFVPADCKNL